MNSRSAWLTVLNETEFEELKETDKNEFNTIDWYDCQDGVDDKEFDDLKGPPDFTRRSHVRFLTKAVNSSIDFDCAVMAFPVAEINWLKNGIPMKEKTGKYIFNRYTLTVKYLTSEDNGNYTCEVRNEYGAINRTITLEVQKEYGSAPIMEDISNQTVLTGTNVTFSCRIVMSDSQPLLQWLRHFKKNDSYVNEKGEPYVKTFKSSGFKSTIDDPQHLVLQNVTKEDEGWYTCLVANTVGTNYRSAWLTVLNETEFEGLKETDKDEVRTTEWYDYQDEVDDTIFDDIKGPPEFKRRNHVRFLAKAVNSSIDVDCDVMAFPVAEINWLKNGIPMKEKTGKYIFNRYNLTVKYLTREDNGNYTCEVRNEYGSINRTITLEVQKKYGFAPIMEDVRNQTALTGTNVTFSCRIVLSDSQPLLQWLRHIKTNDAFVNEKGEPYVKILQSSGFKSTIDDPQHLVLRNVTKEDEGWYTCLVANNVGMNYRSAWLTVLSETEYEELR
ncbi:fibroblast growth factor receptor 3-like isoform X2 [Ruditapes philippinarum]|uniref:fibroblast growth factor receptor 3-like isoform X2 n=1 Tax=Ruditapes philippinarum TaxID=129788 RepID=UPI00295B8138|nr:fibroblast growth factor receptor 3-like isoform X2 [Ruditapes philippinarum]